MQKAVLIAGAGIGGLTLACALAKKGIEARVFERAPSLGAAGAGITVQANAMAALRHVDLRLMESVAAEGRALCSGAILAPDGRVLRAAPFDAAAGVDAPVVAIHRARLHHVLMAAAGEGRLALGHAATGYEEDEGGVTLRLEGGGAVRGAALVGADGLRSAVRAAMLGDGEPRYAGYTSWRGVCRAPASVSEDTVSETWGRGLRFGVVPIGRGEIYWFATANAPPGGRDAPDPRPALVARFGGWHAPIPALLEATRPEAILRTDIRDRPPASRWSTRRVTLLGDAAHPMTPNLGQGGCQAIEDAVVLADLLAKHDRIADALAAYEARRIPRANAVVERARQLGQVGQWENPLSCRVRDLAMRLVPERMMARSTRELMTFPG